MALGRACMKMTQTISRFIGLFGLCPQFTLPKYWSCQIFFCLFGLLPIIWLSMDHLISPSLILAKILATQGRPNPAPKNWLANFGKVACGHKPNRPYVKKK
jgi:hypothetical protein